MHRTSQGQRKNAVLRMERERLGNLKPRVYLRLQNTRVGRASDSEVTGPRPLPASKDTGTSDLGREEGHKKQGDTITQAPAHVEVQTDAHGASSYIMNVRLPGQTSFATRGHDLLLHFLQVAPSILYPTLPYSTTAPSSTRTQYRTLLAASSIEGSRSSRQSLLEVR
jgi:hypothetical protein